MAIHFNNFREELYQEHLEEAAFRYETRINWLTDKEIGWQDLEEIDLLLEAHLDALVVGGTLALKVCIQALPEADPTILHAIVRVFCRHRLIDRFAKIWTDFDFSDQEKIRAIGDALKWECPESWQDSLLKVFATPKKEMYPLLCPCVAFRSRRGGSALLAALPHADVDQLPDLIWAISRCEHTAKPPVIAALGGFLTHADDKVVTQATSALLMLGERRALSAIQNRMTSLPLLFALAANVAQCAPIFQHAQKGMADESCLLALGVLGDLAALPLLLNYLKHPDLAPMAAQALQLISGAALYEDVHEADKVEEDELFSFELEAYKKGELPKNIDGNPYGSEVRKLTTDSVVWVEWFQTHNSAFIKGQRYRNGHLYSPRELLANLLDNQTPYQIRCIAYDELVIRYGMNLPFFADELIANQQAQLNEIYCWIEKSATLFPESGWLFHGH